MKRNILRISLCFFIFIIFAFFVGFNFLSKKHIKDKTHISYQKHVQETVLPSLYPFSPDSIYVVCILSYRCESCWNHIENIKQYNDLHLFDRLVVFGSGEKDDEMMIKFNLPFEIIPAEEEALSSLTSVSPTMFYIKNDTIQHVVQGIIPSVYLFEKQYLQ